MKKLEYIWLDGYQPEPNLRSKVKVTDDAPSDWSFDGSSTQQAEGGSSDCIIRPVNEYKGPRSSDGLIMCEVLSPDKTPHPSNTRNAGVDLLSEDWWFGFEQEFFFTNPEDGSILGWEDGTPRPQGDYYCGVGSGNVRAREVSEAHMDACLEAGIQITGTNAEVALGQWEYCVLGKGIKAADDLWVSRYLLHLIAEEYGVSVNLHPKPQEGDWNGSGMHTNFSNGQMRDSGTEELMNDMCEKLGAAHQEGIKNYGSDNDMRLTGKHETQSIETFSYGVSDRGASIRIPIYTVENNWNGYLEDRRPASNADPYRIITHIVGTLSK
jgi:glutamine synthetase